MSASRKTQRLAHPGQSALRTVLAALLSLLTPSIPVLCQAEDDAALPKGVKAIWALDKAYHETTPTRERICINGLWHWQPALNSGDDVPEKNWGYFKVPGCWPGITDYMQ